jgi:hypothetical protein
MNNFNGGRCTVHTSYRHFRSTRRLACKQFGTVDNHSTLAEGQIMEEHLVEGQMVPVPSQRKVEQVCTFITESYFEFTNLDITQDAK